MKSCSPYHCRPLLSVVTAAALIASGAIPAAAQQKKSTKAKPSAAAKAPAKSPGAATQLEQHISANLKFLTVLSRYADTLASATDADTATAAVPVLESITRDAISAGEAVVKLGRPTPELEAKIAKDPDISVTSRRVAEQTRSAIQAIAANAAVKPVLSPAIENFQNALNTIQQTADDPTGPAGAVAKKPEGKTSPEEKVAKENPPATPPATPAGLPAKPEESLPATPASEAAAVPPPPPPPEQ